MKISVVAGSSRPHLFGTIRELHRQGNLSRAYVPLGLNLSKINPLRKVRILDRAANRFPELVDIPKSQIVLPEIFYQLGLWLTRNKFDWIGEISTEISHRVYSIIVNQRMKKDSSEVVVIRCGYGNHINTRNKIRICDLGMAHPVIDESLINGKGFKIAEFASLGRIAKLMIDDLNRADRIIVNSDFVKKTCVLAGIDDKKLFTAYLPAAHELVNLAESKFLKKSKVGDTKLVLFVGTLSLRKGIDIFLRIARSCKILDLNLKFMAIGSWSGVSPTLKEEISQSTNIEVIPWISRKELVDYYIKADFLLCPTRSDGGARVITEAMLFGAVVLTSNVSGSPIVNGVDGFEFDIQEDEDFIKNVLEVLEDESRFIGVGNKANRTVTEKLSIANYMNNFLKACSIKDLI